MAMEAAAYFGTSYEEFLRKPVDRRAEMIAHMMIRAVRNNYLHEKEMEKHENAKRTSTGQDRGYYNPAERQMRKWMLPPSR